MPANEYHFVSRWRVEGTPDEVYAILDEPRDLPSWWPSVYLAVTELPPDLSRGSGRIFELHTKGWLPYTLTWRMRRVESHPPHGFSLEAWGDFVGRGVWTMVADGAWCDVTYDWRIRADKPLLRVLSFALKPIFSANHHWAMARGEESLRLALAHRRVKPDDEREIVGNPPGPTWPR